MGDVIDLHTRKTKPEAISYVVELHRIGEHVAIYVNGISESPEDTRLLIEDLRQIADSLETSIGDQPPDTPPAA